MTAAGGTPVARRFAGVVLAAGDSRRMGTPKGGIDVAGRSFLARALDALDAARVAPLVVVAGRDHEALRAALPAQPRADLLINPEPARGQLSSLKVALRALTAARANAIGAVVSLVDHPAVRAATIARLTAALTASTPEGPGAHGAPEIAIPRYAGRRGHPVAYLRSVWEELLAAPEDVGARAVVRRLPGRVVEIEVDDPGILLDLDTPEDLARWLAARPT
jgi:molybdenum cofactor cytidylyltransferase